MDPLTPDIFSKAVIRPCGNWTVHEWPEAFSTNDLGRMLPPWSIAKAVIQHGGRGRMNRKWYSDKGGLWTSFVVPLDDSKKDWGPLPLVAGLALLDVMEAYGIKESRLRWPNDLLVRNAKLAGILVDRPSVDKAVIGIGVNVDNDVARVAHELNDPVTRLADLVTPPPDCMDVLERLASALYNRFHTFRSEGFVPLVNVLSRTWTIPRKVSIETCNGVREGLFLGVDEKGNPRLRMENGEESSVEGAYITRLKEMV